MRKNRQVGGDHYEKLKIQPVEYILANNLGFCEGNVIKYVTRYENKNGYEDLMKARDFIDILCLEKYGKDNNSFAEKISYKDCSYKLTKGDIDKFKNMLKIGLNGISFKNDDMSETLNSIHKIYKSFLPNFDNEELDSDILASKSILVNVYDKAKFIKESSIKDDAKKEILLNMLYYARDISIGCINRHREQE